MNDRRKMTKKKDADKYKNKWLLRNKKNKILLASDSVADVVEEGRKYPVEDVYIEKKLIPGTCFF